MRAVFLAIDGQQNSAMDAQQIAHLLIVPELERIRDRVDECS